VQDTGDTGFPEWEYWLTTLPAREVLLSRGNTADGYPRALTPLTQDLIITFEDRGVRQFLEQNLKAQRPKDAPMPYFISLWGYLYANADQHAALGEAMPGNSRRATYQRYMGLEPDPSSDPPSLSVCQRIFRLPGRAAVVVRMAREALRIRRRIESEIAHIRALRRQPDKLGLPEALGWVNDLEAITPDAWETLIIGAGIAGTMFGSTSRLIARATGRPQSDLVNRLHTGLGGNESAEMGMAVKRLANAARSRPDLIAALRTSMAPEDLATLQPNFMALVADELERFGFHTAPELELEQPTWRQDPAQLLSVVSRHLDSGQGDESAPTDERKAAERELRSQVPLAWRAAIEVALYASRWLMSSRENSKIPAVLIFDELRRVLEGVTPRLVANGVLTTPNDVVLLRYEEFKTVLAGGNGPGTGPLVRRRNELERCRLLRLPEVAEAGPDGARGLSASAITRRGMRLSVPPSEQRNVLRGVGAGSGRATGIVRILEDPFDDFAPGDVLVARTVDPGWSAALSCAGAIVLDMGGVMSHGAMVARELGIPCVVGVRTATSILRPGGIVTVDGATGEITINDEPAVVGFQREESDDEHLPN